jgi:hypothetical protein
MKNYNQKIAEMNAEIIISSNSLAGEVQDIEYIKYFITDGINKQLFEYTQTTNKNWKPTKEEFENLMLNIDVVKELIKVITNKQIEVLQNDKKQIVVSN